MFQTSPNYTLRVSVAALGYDALLFERIIPNNLGIVLNELEKILQQQGVAAVIFLPVVKLF